MSNVILSIKVDINRKRVTINYFHPAFPSKKHCLRVSDEGKKFSLQELRDFVEACFTDINPEKIDEKSALRLCSWLYETAEQEYLALYSNFFIQRATGVNHVNG